MSPLSKCTKQTERGTRTKRALLKRPLTVEVMSSRSSRRGGESAGNNVEGRTFITEDRIPVRTDAYRKYYLSLYLQVRAHMESNGLNAFQNAMRRMAVERGLLRPEELKELLALKLRAMHVDGQRVESMLPKDILDASFLCAIACTYSPARARRLVQIMRRVCKYLTRRSPEVELRFFQEKINHFHADLLAAARLRALS